MVLLPFDLATPPFLPDSAALDAPALLFLKIHLLNTAVELDKNSIAPPSPEEPSVIFPSKITSLTVNPVLDALSNIAPPPQLEEHEEETPYSLIVKLSMIILLSLTIANRPSKSPSKMVDPAPAPLILIFDFDIVKSSSV